MEYSLRQKNPHTGKLFFTFVLILILMEYSLRLFVSMLVSGLLKRVLILILMEYSLRLVTNLPTLHPHNCLNPYSNGI